MFKLVVSRRGIPLLHSKSNSVVYQSARSLSSITKFDTKKFVQSLQTKGGFTQQQAEVAVNIVNKAINDGIYSMTNNLVSKETLSSTSYQQKVDFAKLKGELQTMDKSEFTNLKKEQESLRTDLTNLKNRLKEEITKNQAGVRLDLNLEKGRIREESSIHESKIEDTYTRIDEEIANMQMQIKSVKTQVMQWLIGVSSGTFALLLAFIRFFG
ncbi:putative mitochondrial protein [Scheffersomyces xylosifermentans]|uniref:putative mitochondrial protein n=1 Tax=Scheffersomyces xylosifermentans TaxID=1304137 RepID=UPI00315C4C42